MATCPECEYDEVDTDDMEEGDTLSCPECGKNLVVTGADEVDFADNDDDLDDDDEEEDEDEEDEDEDEDDLEDEDVDEEEDFDE
jgi:ribonuclease E